MYKILLTKQERACTLQAVEPTVCNAVMFSDLVVREQGTGKLSLINCFQALNVHRFPFLTPPFFITVFIANLRGAKGEADVAVRIEEPKSGHVLQSGAGKVAFNEGQTLPEGAAIEIPWPMPPFQVREPGTYKAVVLFNNEKIGERFLIVTQLTGQPQLENPK